MKIAMIGSKGIPANYGGYETFAEKISLIFKKTDEVLVVGDNSNCYVKNEYHGIKTFNSKYFKAKNPIKFYHDSLKIANSWGADVAVMCGIGGVFSIPLFYFSKMKIFVNPDGIGFKRNKWAFWKKTALYFQFMFGSFFVKNLICDSAGIRDFFKEKFKRSKNIYVAEYGSDLNSPKNIKKTDCNTYFKSLNIKKNNYYLVVSRIEPENNIDMIIKGFIKSSINKPLIVVGNINTTHAQKLIKINSKNIRFIGGVYDKEKLSLLRYYCASYFHGHSVGGTNPSLLEAMASANLTIAHDNIFNREVLNNQAFFFKSDNDIVNTIKIIESGVKSGLISSFKISSRRRIKEYYSWKKIAAKYREIFLKNIDKNIS